MASSTDLHVVLGRLSRESADSLLISGHSIPTTDLPDYHSHPLLGIVGHYHDRGDEPHGHLPRVEWDMTNPVFVGQDQGGRKSDG